LHATNPIAEVSAMSTTPAIAIGIANLAVFPRMAFID
jgi:hypothetical protein